jgi:hypothetical protein
MLAAAEQMLMGQMAQAALVGVERRATLQLTALQTLEVAAVVRERPLATAALA